VVTVAHARQQVHANRGLACQNNVLGVRQLLAEVLRVRREQLRVRRTCGIGGGAWIACHYPNRMVARETLHLRQARMVGTQGTPAHTRTLVITGTNAVSLGLISSKSYTGMSCGEARAPIRQARAMHLFHQRRPPALPCLSMLLLVSGIQDVVVNKALRRPNSSLPSGTPAWAPLPCANCRVHIRRGTRA
jgi:hypothetical protein